MRGHRVRLPLAFAAAVVAAGVATVILRPRGVSIEPVAVEAAAYFSSDDLERASDYRDPQRLLGLLGLGVSAGVLVLLVVRPPRRFAAALERGARRPLLGAAAAGAGISLVLMVAGLPLGLIGHKRAVDVGLSTQEPAAWVADLAKSAAIEAALAAFGAAVLLALVRRLPRAWWAPAALAVVAFGAASTFLSPVLIEPLFNEFEPLPAGPLRTEVLGLADRAGVSVGEVYGVDASRRTTGANAYVGGLGSTKRVVLYDNLIEEFPPAEVRSVVAHELAHQHQRDLLRGLAWLALVAPAGLFLTKALAERLPGGPRPGGHSRPGPEALPALALALALVAFAGGMASNVLSRSVEARADSFALDLTREPVAFIGLERRLALRNVSQPDPPGLLHTLFGTHPTTLERIGAGEAFRREGQERRPVPRGTPADP